MSGFGSFGERSPLRERGVKSKWCILGESFASRKSMFEREKNERVLEICSSISDSLPWVLSVQWNFIFLFCIFAERVSGWEGGMAFQELFLTFLRK